MSSTDKVEEKKSISICIPSSVISSKNAYNLQQLTNVVYQIAKAATIYRISEIIVFNSDNHQEQQQQQQQQQSDEKSKKIVFNEENDTTSTSQEGNGSSGGNKESDEVSDALLTASLLQFFITPPYLVKTMFSANLNQNFAHILPKFKYAYKLPKITTINTSKKYKEGIIVPKETPIIKIKKKSSAQDKKKKAKAAHKITVSKYVNVGESEMVKLDITREIPIYSRVTVDLINKKIISPELAYGDVGYKGSYEYLVRIINNEFEKIFIQSPITNGYSSTIFVNCNDYFGNNEKKTAELPECDPHKTKGNVLLVFGNLNDYPADADKLFDSKLNIPRGCKIEDAVMIGLTKFA